MKTIFCCIVILLINPCMCLASQVIDCHGTDIWNNPVTANIYAENGVGRIVIITNIDSVESVTLISDVSKNPLEVSRNDFIMEFSVFSGQPTSPVQAFRDGAFFVEDFTCTRLN